MYRVLMVIKLGAGEHPAHSCASTMCNMIKKKSLQPRSTHCRTVDLRSTSLQARPGCCTHTACVYAHKVHTAHHVFIVWPTSWADGLLFYVMTPRWSGWQVSAVKRTASPPKSYGSFSDAQPHTRTHRCKVCDDHYKTQCNSIHSMWCEIRVTELFDFWERAYNCSHQ